MTVIRTIRVSLLILWGGLAAAAGDRVAWTNSRVHGSPEPPPPYRTVNAYPNLKFNQPTVLTPAPHSDRLFLAERFGMLYSFRDDPGVETADVFLNLKTDLRSLPDDGSAKGVGSAYGIAFHPDYPKTSYVYVTYTLNPTDRNNHPLLDGTRVSRFEVTQTDPPRAIPESEEIVVTWREGGHNGGCLKFGPDGYLYISTGDATSPSPPDALKAGQDVSNLLSAILRIDVNRPQPDRAYSVPADNPFVALPEARPEIWAYGFRNPWKMSFDRETGDLWVGDVGWELWEMIYHVERGGNYGWSISEGPQMVDPGGKRGPTPIRPPAIALPHSQSSSITGGFVYRGKEFPELRGKYIFGDYDTRGVWGTTIENGFLTEMETLTPVEHRVVAFAEKNDGEVLIVDFNDGTLNRFVKNDAAPADQPFPRRLSETNLFRNVAGQDPSPGVYPFAPAEPMWMDGATAERFVGLPGDSSVRWYPSPRPIPGTDSRAAVQFPAESVLAKTISLETTEGEKKIETQLLHFDGRFWQAYSYRWNDEQTDAELLPAEGDVATFTIPDSDAPEGHSELRWTFQGRQQCLRCHNRWNEHALAFNIVQLNYGFGEEHELSRMIDLGLIDKVTEENGKSINWPRNAEPLQFVLESSGNKGTGAEARAYLHVNCAHCHQRGAGGTSTMDLRYELPLDKLNAIDAPPLQGNLGIEDARLVAPDDPYRSVLFYRMLKSGAGHMPHIGNERVDPRGLRLVSDWILSIPFGWKQQDLVSALYKLDETPASQKRGRQIVDELLTTHRGRMFLAEEFPFVRKTSPALAKHLIERVIANEDVSVRQLFTRYLPASARQPTLGANVRPEQLAALTGDAARGERLFRNETLTQCARCHKVGGRGGEIGPALDDVGKRLKPGELLDSLLTPSKKIDPKFQTWVLVTGEGNVVSGLLVERTDEKVVLVNVKGEKVETAKKDVEALQPQNASLMPDQLLRDLTAEQAGDLLAYLRSLRGGQGERKTRASSTRSE